MKFDIDNNGICDIFCNRLGLYFYFIAAIFIAAIFFFTNNVKAITGTEWAFSFVYKCANGGINFEVLPDGNTYIYFVIDSAPERFIAYDINGINWVDATSSCNNLYNVLVVNYKDQTASAYINGVIMGEPITSLVFDDLNFKIDDIQQGDFKFYDYNVYDKILTQDEINALNLIASSTLINDQNIGKIYEYDNTGALTKIYEIPFLLWALIGSVIIEIFLVFFIFKYYAVK